MDILFIAAFYKPIFYFAVILVCISLYVHAKIFFPHLIERLQRENMHAFLEIMEMRIPFFLLMPTTFICTLAAPTLSFPSLMMCVARVNFTRI